MRGSKQIHGSRAKRRGYRSQRNGTASCWANFSRCLACMAISYRTLIWLRWLWNTGLPFAPRTVILRGFAVYVGLIPSRPEDKGWRGRVPCCQTAPHARSDMFSLRRRGMSATCARRPDRPSEEACDPNCRRAACGFGSSRPDWRNHRNDDATMKRTAKGKRKIDWSRADAMSEAERHAAAMADPDA
jgi:hypothetical protein